MEIIVTEVATEFKKVDKVVLGMFEKKRHFKSWIWCLGFGISFIGNCKDKGGGIELWRAGEKYFTGDK